jgi:predicted amidophosphoribosyltransferase
MELVALGIAAGINSQRLENEFAFLVPVPSTRISQEHPGQVSFRLSHRISQLTEIPLLNLMIKNEQGEFIPTMERYPFSRSIYLIDDQITSGKNARKCVEVLHKMGVTDIKIFAWSASKFELIVD